MVKSAKTEMKRKLKEARIKQVTVYHFDFETNLNFSYGHVASQPYIIVKIDSSDYSGFGECVSPEYKLVEEAATEMRGSNAMLLQEAIPEWMEEKRYRSEREAISVALYDLAGKEANAHITELLGGKKRSRVPGLPAVLINDIETSVGKVCRFINQGFRSIKLKFLGDPDKDLLLLKSLREKIGYDIELHADANCGYKDLNTLLEVTGEFERYRLDYFEDPLDGDFDDYKKLKQNTSLKIMADMYARSLKDLKDVLENGVADVINLHPNHQGGLGRAMKMEKLAGEYGVPVIIGGCGFFGISTAAFQSLASVIGLQYPCGEMGGYFDHGFNVCIVKNPYRIENGFINIPDEPGLGVTVDEQLLAQLAQGRIIIN